MIPGGMYSPGPWRLHVRNIPRTDRAAAVTVLAPSGLPLARLDIETVSDLEAVKNGRLVACAPLMAETLHQVDRWLEQQGHHPDNPARGPIREILNRVTVVPVEFL